MVPGQRWAGKGASHVRFESKAGMCSAQARVRFSPNSDRESGFPQTGMSALPPKADIRGPQSDVRMLICAGGPVSKRVQAFRGTTRGKANVDFDGLCFDCRDW